MDATGLSGNPFSPDLDVTAIGTQSVQVGQQLVLDLTADGGTVTDLDADENPSGDIIRFQLDPDDTPSGATITSDGVISWAPTSEQSGRFELIVFAIDSGTPPLADAERIVVDVTQSTPLDLADIPDQTVAVGAPLEVTITATDPDGKNLSFLLDRDDPDSTTPDDATLEQTGSNTAIIRWTPGAADAGGTFDFSVIVTDDSFAPRSDLEDFTAGVMSVAAVDDTYQVAGNVTLTVDAAAGVLSNDTDSDADAITATIVTTSTNGSVSLATDSSFTYTPSATFQGTDSFTYQTQDSGGDFSQAIVTIEVNSIPVAVDDFYTTDEDATLSIDVALGVLSNDSDLDGDALTVTLIDTTENGTVTLNDEGAFTYVPNVNFHGTDSFTYTASDGMETTLATTVAITVVEQNMFSVAENSAAGTVVGTVTPEGELGMPVVYTFDDASLNPTLEIAADDHIKGNPAGSVVLIEYLDFQCPACQTYHSVVEQLIQDFPDELMVVTRHLPLTSIHDNALAAAIAAEAAGRQDAFDEFGDLLFTNQDDWEFATDPQPFFETYASQLGLDLTQFQSDVADAAIADRVQRDLDVATSLGATATPAFYLQGEPIANPADQSAFATLVQAEVNQVTDVFAINRQTGVITVRDGFSLDFESVPQFQLTVQATGINGLTESINATINVIDIAESTAEGELSSATSDSLELIENAVDQAFADF